MGIDITFQIVNHKCYTFHIITLDSIRFLCNTHGWSNFCHSLTFLYSLRRRFHVKTLSRISNKTVTHSLFSVVSSYTYTFRPKLPPFFFSWIVELVETPNIGTLFRKYILVWIKSVSWQPFWNFNSINSKITIAEERNCEQDVLVDKS